MNLSVVTVVWFWDRFSLYANLSSIYFKVLLILSIAYCTLGVSPRWYQGFSHPLLLAQLRKGIKQRWMAYIRVKDLIQRS